MSHQRAGNTLGLVIGAGGGIGQAITQVMAGATGLNGVITLSRQPQPDAPTALQNNIVEHLCCDSSEGAIADTCRALTKYRGQFSRVVLCTGVLHDSSATPPLWPEKKLEDIAATALQQLYQVNSIVPLLWLRGLLPVLKGEQPCRLAVHSARVGSIGDNRLGGWYGYRMSKAALNMAVRTAAIEYGRRAANVAMIAFHPGTTATGLSAPFRDRVPTQQLLTPQEVATRLLDLMAQGAFFQPGEAAFLDWNGQLVAW